MPTYDYSCKKCGKVTEYIHLISEKPVYWCDDCGTAMSKSIALNITGFVIRGGSPAIHYREKRQRIKKSEELKKKQEYSWGDGKMRLQPNIAGVPMDSWNDAQKLAKEAGLDSESYSPYVQKENKKKIIV